MIAHRDRVPSNQRGSIERGPVPRDGGQSESGPAPVPETAASGSAAAMMSAPAESIAERVRALFVDGGDTMHHGNDNAKLGPSIARANTASA